MILSYEPFRISSLDTPESSGIDPVFPERRRPDGEAEGEADGETGADDERVADDEREAETGDETGDETEDEGEDEGENEGEREEDERVDEAEPLRELPDTAPPDTVLYLVSEVYLVSEREAVFPIDHICASASLRSRVMSDGERRGIPGIEEMRLRWGVREVLRVRSAERSISLRDSFSAMVESVEDSFASISCLDDSEDCFFSTRESSLVSVSFRRTESSLSLDSILSVVSSVSSLLSHFTAETY